MMGISMAIWQRIQQIEGEMYNFVNTGAGETIIEANREDANNFNSVIYGLCQRLNGTIYRLDEERIVFGVEHLFFEVDISLDYNGDGFYEITVKNNLDDFQRPLFDDDAEESIDWEQIEMEQDLAEQEDDDYDY